MLKRLLIIEIVFVLVSVGPAASGSRAGGSEPGVFEFLAKGSHGFKLLALAIASPSGSESDEGELGLFLRRGSHVEVTYSVPEATITSNRIEADLGDLGRIDLTRTRGSSSKAIHLSCLPGGTGRTSEFHYEGTLEFHGEEGFTDVDAHRVRGRTTPFCPIPERGRPAGKALPGARLAVEREVGEDFEADFSAVQDRPGMRTSFSASVMEVKDGIEIHRGVGLLAPSAALRFDGRLRRAIVKPPAPFAGLARFRARPGAPELARGLWSGNLSVDLPGHADLPLTGPGFRASLEHPSR